MKPQTLAEISSWIAVHAAPLAFGHDPQLPRVINRYWTASRCRLGRWTSALKMFEKDMELDDPYHDPWPAIEVVIQEIIISEMLTRIFGAAMVTHDWYNDSDELHGVVHGIQVGHIEVRNRAMRLILSGRADNEEAFDRMNRLRRRIERWTDLFLAQMPACEAAHTFAFEIERVEDFRMENEEAIPDIAAGRQQVFIASLAADLQNLSDAFPANPELNRDIASGVMACFPADRFDSNGIPKTIRQIWLEQSSHDTEDLVYQLEMLDADGV